MNILVLTEYWPTVSNPSNCNFVRYQADALKALGHSVTVVTGRRRRWLRRSDQPLPVNGIRVITPWVEIVPLLNRMRPTMRAACWMWSAHRGALAYTAALGALDARNFDLVLAHGLAFVAPALRMATRRKVLTAPIVLTVHGECPIVAGLRPSGHAMRRFRRALQCARSIAAVGSPLVGYMARFGVDRKTIHVIPNGHVQTQLSMSSGSSGRLRVLTVANLHESKGVDTIVEGLVIVVKQATDISWEWVIVGDGPDRPRIGQMVDRAGLSQHVRFLGRLDHAATLQCYSSADVFCLPSRLEAFGMVFVEAMAAGVPPIGCLGTGAEDSIVHGTSGFLVPPDDPNAVANALQTLARDPSLRERLAEQGKVRARDFTWRNNAMRTVALAKQTDQSSRFA